MTFRKITVFLLVLCLLSGLDGCGMKQADENTSSLWVVTEASCSDGMNLQAEIIAKRMEKKNPGLTVELDILPTDPQEREIRLKQLRTKIMAGDGPDVYLLPTGGTLTQDYRISESWFLRFREISIAPLFQDVEQAMRSGLFYDIQTYYEADRTLGKDALNSQIMDTGTLGKKRYLFPLRFDIPVLLSDSDQWTSFGLDDLQMQEDACSVVEHLLARENGKDVSAGIQLPKDMSLLSPPFDYSTEKLSADADEIARYLRTYQKWKSAAIPSEHEIIFSAREISNALIPELDRDFLSAVYNKSLNQMADVNTISKYISFGVHWSTLGIPLYSCSLADSLTTLGIEKAAQAVFHRGSSIRMYPMRAANNSVAASITYWGAVGGSCQDPALAYRFLRQFLSEEFQWGQYRPRVEKSFASNCEDPQCPGQVENSWPVRTSGSAAALWDNAQYQALCLGSDLWTSGNQISLEIQRASITDADIPALSWEIDEVRFPVTISGTDSLEYALSQLNEPDGTPTDADIDALAQQVYQGLWWHLAEG